MTRYNAVRGGVYDNSVMVEENDGDYVWYEDVEHLEAINAGLLEALEMIATNNELHQIRAAIAKAKGEQP